ncbi:Sec63 Brl domain-containing protein [Amanita rubescens]|nr:Sec63 Brl domain-containing protein [Amanita rubescens]
MAKYNYDDAGHMPAYFLFSFLALFLIPASISSLTSTNQGNIPACKCNPCTTRRSWLASNSRRFKLTKRSIFLIIGWSLLAFLFYKVSNAVVENKVYDPFEILGINTGTSEKEIKSHFKKLSRMYHPDKVKATANHTIEMIQEKFVQITKAYKSLTDESIRKNWELYGNPDGRQEMTTGIALPRWIVESKYNGWVLGVYGLLFGGALPALVGRWWFSSREITKDGIHARSAAEFFKSLREDSAADQVFSTLGKSFTWERSSKSSSADAAELKRLDQELVNNVGKPWNAIQSILQPPDDARRRALILLYAHMLRIDVKRPNLVNEQSQILQHTPLLLNALLNITLSRNWLSPALDVMRLNAYLVQALPPPLLSDGSLINPRAPAFAQLPGITSPEEANTIAPSATGYNDFVRALQEKGDHRLSDVKTALSTWGGHVDLVDVAFKVIGERVVSPSAIVYLVVKLRLKSPIAKAPQDDKKPELDVDAIKRRVKRNDEQEEEFLKSRGDAEESKTIAEYAHAPHWPGERKPSWWIILADEKSNRIVIQFQSPPNVGMFTWKVYVVSDTFVGGEVTRDITMKIEEAPVSAVDEVEDEISDPDEDSLAGQMAAMRGGSVKKRKEESDDEDSLDEESDEDSSSSDSD